MEKKNEKVIIALDTNSLDNAETLARVLGDKIDIFKIGLELFSACGPDAIDMIRAKGAKVFLDLKLHDIPNTVFKAALEIASMEVSFFTVHALGGKEMMKKAKEAAGETTKVLGVTILTSLDKTALEEAGINSNLEEEVVKLALLAKSAGLDGVVCSPQEIKKIRQACGKDFIIVTPGVRPKWAEKDDQKRVMTPTQAIDNGASYIVVGRPITQADDPLLALDKLWE